MFLNLSRSECIYFVLIEFATHPLTTCLSISGVKPSPHKLTAADCLELGTLAYKNDKYVRMLEWLEEAERIRMLNETQGIDRLGNLSAVSLYEHLAWSYYIVSLKLLLLSFK